MSEYRTLIEADSPYRIVVAASGPQGAPMSGDVTGIDSITFRCADDTPPTLHKYSVKKINGNYVLLRTDA